MLAIAPLTDILRSGQSLSSEQMRRAIEAMLTGELPPTEARAFLEALADKGETVDEIVGAAEALRQSMVRITSRHAAIADTCGTGGDGAKTFNISTAAAIVAAAAGVPVAKHGNRKITSSTGSADVLGELGINLEAPPAVAQQCLEEIGLCFCFAPYFHPAMRHVGPVRREIGRPTIFNRLGPLANPAGATHQVLGVGDASLQSAMAEALQRLGTTRSLVVRGEDGVDEISLAGPTRVLEVTPQAIIEHHWEPSDFGVQPAPRTDLLAETPAESAECIREVLRGESSPKRDVVVINAAATVWLTGLEPTLQDAVRRCAAAIDSGQARRVVESLATHTHSSAND
ncbi:MAG: anthranilate phosphoribosyltransferase [Planctomycetota bacterium]|nr:MAG: anthranilate phosphoribosyltransferase [Planctomycetota bacterium]